MDYQTRLLIQSAGRATGRGLKRLGKLLVVFGVLFVVFLAGAGFQASISAYAQVLMANAYGDP